MISKADYFKAYDGHKDITPAIEENAEKLLDRVNRLLDECEGMGWKPRINPATGTMISGQKNGGWRPPEVPIGSPNSAHKQGRAVDVADADGSLDNLISDGMLVRHGLYRESPEETKGWCHLTDRAPGSGRRTFMP